MSKFDVPTFLRGRFLTEYGMQAYLNGDPIEFRASEIEAIVLAARESVAAADETPIDMGNGFPPVPPAVYRAAVDVRKWMLDNSATAFAGLTTVEERDAALAMRPQWAQGHTSDSVAAQVSSVALQQIWSLVGVDNQTAAMTAVAGGMSDARRYQALRWLTMNMDSPASEALSEHMDECRPADPRSPTKAEVDAMFDRAYEWLKARGFL